MEVDDLELETRTLLARGLCGLLDREAARTGWPPCLLSPGRGGVLLEWTKRPRHHWRAAGFSDDRGDHSSRPARLTSSASFLPRPTSELPTSKRTGGSHEGRDRSVGTEMLLGMIGDTNSQYLDAAIGGYRRGLFGSARSAITSPRGGDIQRGLDRSDVIVMTGGWAPQKMIDPRIHCRRARRADGDQAGAGAGLRDLFARRNDLCPKAI